MTAFDFDDRDVAITVPLVNKPSLATVLTKLTIKVMTDALKRANVKLPSKIKLKADIVHFIDTHGERDIIMSS